MVLHTVMEMGDGHPERRNPDILLNTTKCTKHVQQETFHSHHPWCCPLETIYFKSRNDYLSYEYNGFVFLKLGGGLRSYSISEVKYSDGSNLKEKGFISV